MLPKPFPEELLCVPAQTLASSRNLGWGVTGQGIELDVDQGSP